MSDTKKVTHRLLGEEHRIGGDGVKIEHDLYDEIIDITRSRQYKFTLNDGRMGYFSVNYREIGSQYGEDIDIRFENIRDMRWADGDMDVHGLPTLEQTLEQIRELLSVEVTA